ncbi:MAG: alpha/beta hydrolase [Flavobacteriia bacterium]|nr:alpha/beta hydrolase [Flavobacteriia bacterium]
MKNLSFILFLLINVTISFSQEIEVEETHEFALYEKFSGSTQVTVQRANLFDSIRNRDIPIIVYHPQKKDATTFEKLVIINHGYGFNNPNSYLGYSFIANYLASKGYFVVSIQHELPTDDSLVLEGENIKELRMPNWERGVQNIEFVINSVRSEYHFIDSSEVTIIGHSNGGDMAMLFATKYPNKVAKVISLDNRRMPIPRTNHPQILSIRSSDQKAGNNASPEKKAEILYLIGEFMNK